MKQKDRSKPDETMPVIEPALCTAIRGALSVWYAIHHRDLPWRHTADPYRIWVSEVMLQQTQVKTMAPFYHRFMQRFPDVHRLARADLQMVLKLWEGLGYYSRARNMHRAAAIVSERMQGRFPDSKEDWLQLPGVGEYIASAVSSIAGGHCHAVVDGNVKRVLARMFCVDLPVNQAAAYKKFHSLAAQVLNRDTPGDHNQAVMELGALICTPRQPQCPVCPVADCCCALKTGQVTVFPRRVKRSPLPVRRRAVGAVALDGKFLLVRRPDDGFLGGLWEFPGGAVEPGGNPAQACVQAIRAAVNLSVAVETHLITVRHAYTHFKLHMDLFRCRWQAGRVHLHGPQAFRWVDISEISAFPLHGAMHKAMTALRRT
jgi:A/G-specific adenine glycosylase